LAWAKGDVMAGRSLTIEQILTLLAATPPRIAALTAGLATSPLHAAPNPMSGPQVMLSWPKMHIRSGFLPGSPWSMPIVEGVHGMSEVGLLAPTQGLGRLVPDEGLTDSQLRVCPVRSDSTSCWPRSRRMRVFGQDSPPD